MNPQHYMDLILYEPYSRFVHNNSKHGRRAKRLDPSEGKYYNCKYQQLLYGIPLWAFNVY